VVEKVQPALRGSRAEPGDAVSRHFPARKPTGRKPSRAVILALALDTFGFLETIYWSAYRRHEPHSTILKMKVIRKARAEEAETARDVVLAAYQRYVAIIGSPPGPMLDDYAARFLASQLWVLDDDGVIVGVLVLEDGPACFMLDNIAVRPDRQGCGFGRRLLDFAEQEAARCGWGTITLYTNAVMTENIAIYAARGYAEQDRRTEKGLDRVYMEKRL
jgi:GNAT superfamily N-acetyltransferase